MADWAELQQDLLAVIAKRIDLLEDFSAFGRVCRSWRSVAVKQNFKGSQQIPWLMLAEEQKEEEEEENTKTGDERRFVRAMDGNIIGKMVLPEARGKRCLESLGWLITIDEDGEMNLLHPLSRVQIGLPCMNTLKYYEKGGMASDFITIQKAVLSSSPSRSDNYVLMVIYEGHGWLGFWRAGDKTWTTIETRLGAFYDINYYKGKFYGVDTQGMIFECDVGGPNPTLAQLVGSIPNRFLMYEQRAYIVELEGALLIVVRDGCHLKFLDEDDGNFDFDNIDESKIDYGTHEFQLFEVDLSNRKWTETKSLGDNALFLGDSASISVQASKFPGIRPNCIYYTDDCWPSYIFFKRGGGKDMGIYNLEDRSQTPCYTGQSFSRICPPLWVRPYF